MKNKFEFASNSLLIPPEDQLDEENYKMLFVEKGENYKRNYIFEDVFEDEFEYLRVIPLPDFDAKDMELLDKAIDLFEDNPEQFEDSIYEIAKVYH